MYAIYATILQMLYINTDDNDKKNKIIFVSFLLFSTLVISIHVLGWSLSQQFERKWWFPPDFERHWLWIGVVMELQLSCWEWNLFLIEAHDKASISFKGERSQAQQLECLWNPLLSNLERSRFFWRKRKRMRVKPCIV